MKKRKVRHVLMLALCVNAFASPKPDAAGYSAGGAKYSDIGPVACAPMVT